MRLDGAKTILKGYTDVDALPPLDDVRYKVVRGSIWALDGDLSHPRTWWPDNNSVMNIGINANSAVTVPRTNLLMYAYVACLYLLPTSACCVVFIPHTGLRLIEGL